MDDIPEDVGVPIGEPTPGEKIPQKPQKGAGPAKKAVQKGRKELTNKAAKWAAKQAASVAAKAVAVAAGPYAVIAAVVLLVIAVIVALVAAYYLRGSAGKTIPQRAGKNDPNIAKVLSLTKQETGEKGSGNMKINFLNSRDLEYIQSGQVDKRLLASLVYLAEHHEHIRVSHIVSGYEDMQTNVESGSFHDKQLANNISAHKDGLAADIDEIDYVNDKCDCGTKIPVKVSWQSIGENPYSQTPDALNQIKGPDDFAKPAVKDALAKMGVSGVDQADLVAKMKASSTLSKITSVYDLTKPDVIAAFAAIGVGGVDNSQLQSGLKRLQALQSLSEMNLGDLAALKNSQAAKDLFSQIGVNMDNATIDQLAKFQALQTILATVNSSGDLSSSQVQQVLQSFGINSNDPGFKQAFDYMQNANILMKWDGNLNDPGFVSAMKAMGIPINDQTTQALQALAAAQNALKSPSGTIISDAQTILALEKMGIIVENPETQKVLDQVRAAYNVLNWSGSTSDAALAGYLSTLGIPINTDTLAIMSKIAQGQNIQDVLNDPQLLGQYASDFATLKTWQQIFSAQNLDTFKTGAMNEALRQLGLSNYSVLVGQLNDLSKFLSSANFQAAAQAVMNTVLSDLKLPASVGSALGQFADIQTLANIHSPTDLLNPQVQNALKDLGVPSSVFDQLGQAGSIMSLLQIKSPTDLLKPGTLAALNNLGIINVTPELLGQIGSIQALMQIDSIGDLFNPSTILALNNLGLISLAGPVAAALMVASFIDNLTGGKLLGGLLGGESCEESTSCYKPTAQANVYSVIENLLQMPYDLGDKEEFRVTQLIVYSLDYTRSKDPSLDSKLDSLYWPTRAANVGLFTMPEAWQNIHIGY